MNKIDVRYHKAEIILNRPFGVVQDKTDSNHFAVRAEKDPILAYSVKFYAVYDEDGKIKKYRGDCDCIDYMYQSNVNIEHKCKHILAVYLGVTRGKKFKKVNVVEYLPEAA